MNSTLLSALGKYREIVIAILFFLLFDTGVLILNFHLASTIQQDAVGVNLAGRQRMLSQRLAKSLLQAQQARAQAQDPARALTEIAEVYRLFGSTLEGFKSGAEVTGGNGKPVWLASVAHVPDAQQALQATSALWVPYQEHLRPLLALGSKANDAALDAALVPAVRYAQENNLKILKLMNDLTTALEQVATQKANQLRLIQTVGILLALANFFFILFHFIRKLRQSDALTEAAQKEIQEILDTVNEGLFLLDQQGVIGAQHSAALPKILGVERVAGQNFLGLLRTMVPEKLAQTAEEYLQLLFSPHVNESLTGSLNPLGEVAVMTRNAQGGYQTRHLEFSFRRVFVAGRLTHLLATVNDISRRIELAHELDNVQAQSRSQWVLLEQIAHLGPAGLRQFTVSARQGLSEINEILREPQGALTTLHAKVQRIFAKVHGIKGDAASMNLKLFASQLHGMEDILAKLRQQAQLAGEDFLPIAVRLDEIISHVEALEKIGAYLPGDQAQTQEQPSCMPWGDLARLVEDSARALGKKAVLRLDLSPQAELASGQRQALRAVLIQLVRNAVAHGIEAPAARSRAGKAEAGLVHIVTRINGAGELEFSVRDDGAGIDLEAIRAKLQATGESPGDLAGWDERRLMSALFSSGFSTVSEATEQAGRGIGMALVKDKLHELGARLKIQSVLGKGTAFHVLLPLTSSGTAGRYATA